MTHRQVQNRERSLPHRSLRRRGIAVAASSILAALGVASAAQAAATVTVTGDDGNPVSIAQPPTIRNMSPKIGIGFPAGATGYFNATFVGPDGVAVGTAMDCYSYDNWSRLPDFRGNGTYTVSITNFAKADTSCRSPTSTENYTYVIASSATITPPPGPFLIRALNSYHTNTLSLPVAGNPGATTYDVQYELNAVQNPDGSLGGTPQTGYVNGTTGTIDLLLTTPGDYTVVYRAVNGQYGSPWSAPVHVQAVVPFDLLGISWPDSRGPSYVIKGTINDRNIRGNVSIALARLGKRNRYGAYKTVAKKVKISSKSTFTKRFTERTTGTYRVRVHYAGSAIAPAGSIIYKIKITRRLFYK
jgi:hypothetical protein